MQLMCQLSQLLDRLSRTCHVNSGDSWLTFEVFDDKLLGRGRLVVHQRGMAIEAIGRTVEGREVGLSLGIGHF